MILFSKDYKLPEDRFFQITPIGEFPAIVEGEDGEPVELIQVVDAEALRLMLAAFAEDQAKPSFPGLLVDYDHFSEDAKLPSRAAGWGDALQGRADGLYAHVNLTPAGEQSIATGEYRGCSPVWEYDNLGGGKVRPRKLLSVALTNDPNLKTLKPLSNRSKTEGAKTMGGSTAQGVQTPANPQAEAAQQGADGLSAIAAALGLKPDATAAEALQAITALASQLKDLQAKAADAQAEQDLQEFGDQVANRAELKKQLISNRDGTLASLRAMKATKTIVNRQNNALPDGAEQADAKEKVRSAKIHNRAVEIQKSRKISFRRAWDLAAAETPKEG